MKRALLLLLLIALTAEGLYLLDSSGYAQERGTRYFPETGHNLRGAFLNHFQEKGGLEILGYPITEEFQEDGLLVQYFQRARMEWHPDKKRVQLGLLGEEYLEARGLDPALRAPVEPIVEETTPIPQGF